MNQHTPGPCNHYDEGGELFGLVAKGLLCCRCKTLIPFCLIAKAPEMYEELRRLSGIVHGLLCAMSAIPSGGHNETCIHASALLREIEGNP